MRLVASPALARLFFSVSMLKAHDTFSFTTRDVHMLLHAQVLEQVNLTSNAHFAATGQRQIM